MPKQEGQKKRDSRKQQKPRGDGRGPGGGGVAKLSPPPHVSHGLGLATHFPNPAIGESPPGTTRGKGTRGKMYGKKGRDI